MKIGIDLGGSHIAVGVVDKDGKILDKREKRLRGIEKKAIKKTIENEIITNVKEYSKLYKISDIGIAVPGTVSKETVIKSVNLGLTMEHMEAIPVIRVMHMAAIQNRRRKRKKENRVDLENSLQNVQHLQNIHMEH